VSSTIPYRPPLRLAEPGDAPTSAAAKPVLRPQARLDVEQAREFLMRLPRRTRGADLPEAAADALAAFIPRRAQPPASS
jgi:hypothetical protein